MKERVKAAPPKRIGILISASFKAFRFSCITCVDFTKSPLIPKADICPSLVA